MGIDFPQFYEAALMWLRGNNPYLSLISSPGPFNYPPTAFWFLGWVGLFAYPVAGAIWNIGSWLAYLLAVILLLGLAEITLTWANLVMIFVIFSVLFFPLKFNMGNGQINNFVLLWIVSSLYAYQRQRKWTSSLLLAFAAAVKLTPVGFLLVFGLRRDWRQIARVVVVLSGLWLGSLVLIPAGFHQVYYAQVFSQGFSPVGKEVVYNQSLWGALARSLPTSAAYSAYLVLAVAIFAVTIKVFWTKPDFFRLASAVSCLVLLLHPLSWQHHFVLATIPLILLWCRSNKFLMAIAYLLIAINLQRFFPWFSSPQFLGALLLWFLSLHEPSRTLYSGHGEF